MLFASVGIANAAALPGEVVVRDPGFEPVAMNYGAQYCVSPGAKKLPLGAGTVVFDMAGIGVIHIPLPNGHYEGTMRVLCKGDLPSYVGWEFRVIGVPEVKGYVYTNM
jgi:hypothetical protein